MGASRYQQTHQTTRCVFSSGLLRNKTGRLRWRPVFMLASLYLVKIALSRVIMKLYEQIN